MTDDRLYEFPESIPGQLAMSTDVERFVVELEPLGFYVVDTFTGAHVAPDDVPGVNLGQCYSQRFVAVAHASRLNGFASWAGSVVDA